ncbi:Peptidyl-prolyl cis-trans isomerase FKBP5 [Papilio machaon]|uniref:peptidylprolyl isomerase n=1 Tax=Papilio machaon TaxID=76193 RepID=A0A0N0PDA5_PAPMA|nr:Peptidyl-prolyl cis-trans isomerase FKBP5 [Papilio machaon]
MYRDGFLVGQYERVWEVQQTAGGRALFTPRLYTEDTWGSVLAVDNFHSLPCYHMRTFIFSTRPALADIAHTDRMMEWTVDLYPKGVWFRKSMLIAWSGTYDVPEAVLRTVRIAITCLSVTAPDPYRPEPDVRVKVTTPPTNKLPLTIKVTTPPTNKLPLTIKVTTPPTNKLPLTIKVTTPPTNKLPPTIKASENDKNALEIQRALWDTFQANRTANGYDLVELEGRLQADGKVFDTRTLSFPLGEGTENNICEGIERALEKFQKGEKSRLTIAPKYGFKSEGNASLGVPPDSTLEYIVKLVNFEKAKESWAMDGTEKLEQAKIFKEKGTGYFKNNKYQLAIKMYKRVTSLLEDMIEDTSESEDNKTQAKELLLSAYLNLSLVYLKVTPAHHFEARDFATKALKFDPENVKGLFRRGQALLGLGEAEQAIEDFQKVVNAEPQNKVCKGYNFRVKKWDPSASTSFRLKYFLLKSDHQGRSFAVTHIKKPVELITSFFLKSAKNTIYCCIKLLMCFIHLH